ncbi:hypothetical protein ACLBWT_18805 [Paenibacillus sp. D51F]
MAALRLDVERLEKERSAAAAAQADAMRQIRELQEDIRRLQ